MQDRLTAFKEQAYARGFDANSSPKEKNWSHARFTIPGEQCAGCQIRPQQCSAYSSPIRGLLQMELSSRQDSGEPLLAQPFAPCSLFSGHSRNRGSNLIRG